MFFVQRGIVESSHKERSFSFVIHASDVGEVSREGILLCFGWLFKL